MLIQYHICLSETNHTLFNLQRLVIYLLPKRNEHPHRDVGCLRAILSRPLTRISVDLRTLFFSSSVFERAYKVTYYKGQHAPL